jgi:hypothetical protein
MILSRKDARNQGLENEKLVIHFLQTLGDVKPSMASEDILQDIDCHLKFKKGQFYHPVSIKCNESGNQRKPFVFELSQSYLHDPVEDEDATFEAHPIFPAWNRKEEINGIKYWVEERKSWYHTGRGHYVIWKQPNVKGELGEVYMIDRFKLHEYVFKKGFDKTTKLTNAVREREQKGGSKVLNTTVGLIEIQKLLDAKVAVILGRL